jgi:hypothetical protein
MKRGKWIAATAALAIGLSAGAFAQDQAWQGRDRNRNVYSQRDTRDRAQAWNNNYRGDGDRYSDRDSHDRDRDHYVFRDRQTRDRDHRDRDHARRDRDDRGRDRD